MMKNTSFFSNRLITWYLKNKRDLPWRKTKQVYPIWLSEIILQQTKVAQGLPYYLEFIKTFPSIKDLANAPEDRVLKLWQGLGYYSRARNLHATAKYVHHDLQGVFPDTYASLLLLKGVGDYTASAIASICYNESTAVVDGNVYRVLSRFFGIDLPINSTKGIKYFKILAQKLIDTSQPGTHNQAIMEFGARYCVPQNPKCKSCIFNDKCSAFKEKNVSSFPVKKSKAKIKKLFFNYLVIISEKNETIIKQRTEKGIWHNLYEFPLIETPHEVTIEQLRKTTSFIKNTKYLLINSVTLYNNKSIIHKLSHRHIYAKFWIIEVPRFKINTTKNTSVELPSLTKFAVPVLISNFISEFFRNAIKTKK